MWSAVTEEVPIDKQNFVFFNSSTSLKITGNYFVITATGRCVVTHVQMKFVIFISLRG